MGLTNRPWQLAWVEDMGTKRRKIMSELLFFMFLDLIGTVGGWGLEKLGLIPPIPRIVYNILIAVFIIGLLWLAVTVGMNFFTSP